jgi:hypothetical protein
MSRLGLIPGTELDASSSSSASLMRTFMIALIYAGERAKTLKPHSCPADAGGEGDSGAWTTPTALTTGTASC